MVLHDFLTRYRDLIITRTREKVTNRPWPLASTSDLENGVPLFLTQLSQVLQAATPGSSQTEIGSSAALHGRELLALGFNVSQVVHDYGDICQAITELVVELDEPITPQEFHLLNRCLDTAIAEAVTAHALVTAETRATGEAQRSGQLAHELRNMLGTAVFAFEALKSGSVAINGSTGAVLGRSLMGLRDLIDSTLSDIRMTANQQHSEWTSASMFLGELATAARLHAESRDIRFSFEPVAQDLNIHVDRQLLASAVMNLLNNAFKFTPATGHAVLRAHREDRRVKIEVEDECGGLKDGHNDPFRPFQDRRSADRSGLGLGLSARRGSLHAVACGVTLDRVGHGRPSAAPIV
jgi:signal transduction histidine kinase